MKESLTDFIETVCGESHLRVEDDYGDGFVRLRSAEAERRQAKHDIRSTEDIVIELLRNARDAHARMIALAYFKDGSQRHLLVIDDGDGVPSAMHERIFEARVTSKLDSMHVDKWGVHGRGMALYSIAVNAKVARLVSSAEGMGCALEVITDLTDLPEKTDQSTAPCFVPGENDELELRGPHNIQRIAWEFAAEHEGSLELYIGSPTEVAATLFAYGEASLSPAARAFAADDAAVPLVKRLAFAVDPADFVVQAQALGLNMSERSARRIMEGTIEPLVPVSESLDAARTALMQDGGDAGHSSSTKGSAQRLQRALRSDARGLKLAREDLDEFSSALSPAWEELAAKYYLESDIRPQFRVDKDGVHVFFPAVKLR